MLYQVHHQFPDGRVEMIAQDEASSFDDVQSLFDSVRDKFPPPEGAIWGACNENAPEFVKMKDS